VSEGWKRAPDILADPDALARRVAEWLAGLARASQGRFAVALAGGSTPRRLYEHLAAPPLRADYPWARSHWFWGDERFVPPDDPRSNGRMVREALLAHVPVPPENIHTVPTEGIEPAAAAAVYERELKSFYGAERLDPRRPLFDVTLLGLGEDGHTASLFPGTAALAERERWVVAVLGAKAEPRITLTYPALESSAEVAFLVAGAEKGAILRRFRAGDDDLPASRLRPVGRGHLFVDAAAVGREDGGSS
jgi:6-phosphogluconolactonase